MQQQQFKESGPSENAEQMFADDPEMLEMIRRARKEQGVVSRKPLWWQIVMVALGVVFAALTTVPALLEVVTFHPVLPAGGLLGGCAFALGLLGHRPGRYEIDDGSGREKEKATLWKPLPVPLRLGAFAVGLGAPALAIGLQLLS